MTQHSTPPQGRRVYRGRYAYALAAAWTCVALTAGYVFNVRWSAYGLAAMCLTLAAARATGKVDGLAALHVRSRLIDVALLCVSGLALVVLALGIPVS